MSIDWDKSWKELGVLAAGYAVAVIMYSLFMYKVYGQHPDMDVQALLKLIPSFLQDEMGTGTKLKLITFVGTVVFYTLPLTFTMALLSFNFASDKLSFPGAVLCIVGPFALFYLAFNRAVFSELPLGWTSTPVYILKYYMHDYGIQALGSVLFGGYAGYKLAQVTGSV